MHVLGATHILMSVLLVKCVGSTRILHVKLTLPPLVLDMLSYKDNLWSSKLLEKITNMMITLGLLTVDI